MASPSLPRVRWMSVPLLRRYYETLRRPAAPPAVLRFLRLAVPSCAPAFVSSFGPTPAKRPGAFWTGSPRQFVQDGSDRTSQVPGEPLCAYALFSDPGGTERTRPIRCSGTAPARNTTKAPSDAVISGLNRTALALAVYASQCGSHRPTQDSLLVAGQALPGGIDYPQGSIERFPSCLLHLIPLSQASPGAGCVPLWSPRRPERQRRWEVSGSSRYFGLPTSTKLAQKKGCAAPWLARRCWINVWRACCNAASLPSVGKRA